MVLYDSNKSKVGQDEWCALSVGGFWAWFALKKLDRTLVFLFSPSNKNRWKVFVVTSKKNYDSNK
jgi:hypothetical protein